MKKLIRLGQYLILSAWAIFCIFPLFWMVSTSFKPQLEWITTPIHWLPRDPTFVNYQVIFAPGSVSAQNAMLTTTTGSALKAIKDSLILTSTSTILALLIGTATAYAISRFKTGGRNLPFAILQVRMLPPVAALVPLLIMFSTIHQYDAYWPLVLLYTGFTMPFAVWLMKSFIDEVPRALEEAAIVDGCSNVTAIWRVTIPLVAGGLAATGLFVFIIVWSDFIVALTLTQERVVTLPVQLSKYVSGTSGQLYGPQAALGTIAVIPVVIFGLLIQRYLVRGLTFGAIKR